MASQLTQDLEAGLSRRVSVASVRAKDFAAPPPSVPVRRLSLGDRGTFNGS